ncbi:MAG: sulfatase-like hydrolase/transferase [Chloroflexi bacterium]|nr:sulfatase-like hydrolase/transferase [Chloroflexota bacterium]
MPTKTPPNILLIMTDQHRWDYLGCYGADFVDTPNIDRLAASGLRFTNAFTSAPVCAPARIGLATGMHPSRIRALDNNSYLPNHLPTYYQRLRDRGYRVGCVGKLDLAKPDTYNGRYGDRPTVYRWGFTHPEEVEGKMHAAQGDPSAPHGPYTHYLNDRGRLLPFWEDYRVRAEAGWILGVSHDSVLPTEDFHDAYIGRRAARWIENIAADFPWHLFVSFVGPHDPFDPPTEYAERYRDAAMPDAVPKRLDGKPQWLLNRQKDPSAEELAHIRRQYCALIKLIDDQVGLLLDALTRRDMLDNTVIIFTSDHGEMLGDHGLFQKQVAYEPSIHIPLLVAGPGMEPGKVSDTIVDMMDLNPTICALAGVESAPNMDARSFDQILLGQHTEHRQEIMTALTNFRCLRTATTKFVDNGNDMPELYDLAHDPQETHNIAADCPDQVAAMRERLKRYLLQDKRENV